MPVISSENRAQRRQKDAARLFQRLCERARPYGLVALVAAAAIARAQTGSAGFEGPARYTITNPDSHKALELDRIDRSSVLLASPRDVDNQDWDIEPASQGWVYIRNATNGKALEASGSGDRPAMCGRFLGGSRQQWRIEVTSDGSAMILSRDGRALDFQDGRDGAYARIADRTGAASQRFTFRRVARLHAPSPRTN
jgi:hypothetical protein